MSFWVKTSYLIKKTFSNYVWDIPNHENKVFISFDDGPTPAITEWTLEQLKKYNAKATFFCIGKNIEKYPEVFEKIIREKHAIGNHTYDHQKGWETPNNIYNESVNKCGEIIRKLNSNHCNLFRPPYGKIKPSQSKILRKSGYKIIMWDVLSKDFDPTITPAECLDNVLKNVTSGSIIVFHDSVKAEQNLKYVLPKTLAFLKEKGYVCDSID